MTAATTRNADFAYLLNENCPNEMLWEEVAKKDYFFNKCKKDLKAYGSKIIVPFMSAGETSVRYGKLTAESDISQCKPVRGELEAMCEVYGSLIFNHSDLVDQEGRIPEQTFMKVFPGAVERMTKYMRENMSVQMLNGDHFATVTDSTNAATGVFVVDHPERFQLGQKCQIDDDNSSGMIVYVIAINTNTKSVTFSDSRGGSYYNLSAYTAAQNAKFYHDGVQEQGSFLSLRSALLSAANGGAATLHGKTKTAYPFLQALNFSGSGITQTNLLDQLFIKWIEAKTYGKCTANTILLNIKHMGTIMRIMEDVRGAFTVVKSENKPLYGWWETQIVANKNGQMLNVVGLQELDADIAPMVNFDSITIRSKGGLRKIKQPDGSEFFTARAETGYAYIVDLEFHGQVEYAKPAEQAIIHSIPGYTIS